MNKKNRIWLFRGPKEKFFYLKKIISDLCSNYLIKYDGKEIDQLSSNKYYIIYSEKKQLIYTKKDNDSCLNLYDYYDWIEIFLKAVLLDNSDISKINKINKRALKINNSLIKRYSEIVISIIILFFSIPVLIISSFAIFLEDKKGFIFSQLRGGFKGKPIRIYKLRTMSLYNDENVEKWAERNDLRITKVGKILRLLRIDEIPQLYSVITGEMSLIGPRPEQLGIEKCLIEKLENYKIRQLIKPGLTGWAQIKYRYGSSVNDSRNKLICDFYYIKNYSFKLDIEIFFKTILVVFMAKGR